MTKSAMPRTRTTRATTPRTIFRMRRTMDGGGYHGQRACRAAFEGPHSLQMRIRMTSVRFGSAAMIALLAGGVVIGEAPSGTASRRSEIRRSYGEVAGKLRRLYENLTPAGEQELDALMDRSWSLAEEWILAYLADHPDSSADALAADVHTLSPSSRSEYDDVPGPLQAGAISLTSGTYAIAIHSGSRRSTVLIAARSASGDYRIAWRIRGVPLDKRAEEGELGRWRTSGPGWHDGPLDGKVLRAPDN